MMKKLFHPSALSVLLTIIFISTVGAQTATAQANSITPPAPLEHAQPEAPAGQFGPAPDGWIEIRYSVLSDGSTSNIQVLTVMPPNTSTSEAIEAVENWTFTPAMNNNSAIIWHNNVEYIIFDDEQMPNLASPMIEADYARVQEYIIDEKYSRAQNRADRMIKNSLFSLYDIAIANMQLASIETELGNYQAAYNAIKIATTSAVIQFTPEELAVALQYRFSIELILGLLSESIDTYERRLALSPLPDDHYMMVKGAEVLTALEGDGAIVISATVADEQWRHSPSRRTVLITNVEGQLDSIDVSCNRRTVSIEFQPDVEWTLPDSWGECSLDILGSKGTTFTFVEFK